MSIIFYIVSGLFLLGGISLYVYIKLSYREFCYRENLKENINILLKRAYSSLDYINDNYNDPLNPTHNVLKKTLSTKITFILDIIKTLPQETQEYELKFLINILTETFTRINQDINDIQKITSPLNNIINRLAREKIDYLKQIEIMME